jgi:7 transmembrane sweet-taste receptor of 3 GCPR
LFFDRPIREKRAESFFQFFSLFFSFDQEKKKKICVSKEQQQSNKANFATMKLLCVLIVLPLLLMISAANAQLLEQNSIEGGLNVCVLVPDSSFFTPFVGDYASAVLSYWQARVNSDDVGGVVLKNNETWPVGYDIYDYLSDEIAETTSLAEFVQSIQQANNYVALYTVSSAGARDLSPVAEQLGLVLLTGFQSTPQASAANNFWTLSVGTPPEDRFRSTLEVLALKGARSMSIVVEQFPGAGSNTLPCDGLETIATDLGMTVLARVEYTSPLLFGLDGANLTDYIDEMAMVPLLDADGGAAPDALAICGFPGSGITLLEAMRAADFSPRAILSPADVEFQAVIDDQLGPLVEYVFGMTQWDRRMRIPPGRYIDDGGQAYDDIVGSMTPSASAAASPSNVAQSLAALSVLEQALVTATLPLTMASLQFSAARVSFPSFFGDVRFGVDGVDIRHAMGAFQVREGVQTFVSPLRYATAETVYPVPTWREREQDLGWYQTSEEIVFAVLAAVCAAVSLGWLVFLVVKRECDALRFATPSFLALMLVGSVAWYCSVFTWTIYVTDASCAALPWLLALGFMAMFGSLLLKNVRVYRIWSKGQSLRAYKFTLIELTIYWLLQLVPVVVLLAVWSAVSPLEQQLHTPDPQRPSEDYVSCHASDTAVGFAGALVGYCGITLLANMMLALKTWKVDRAVLREGVSIGLASYTFCLAALIGVAVVASNSIDHDTAFIIRSACILVAGFAVCSFVMVPKLLFVINGKQISDISVLSTTSGDTFASAAAPSPGRRGGGGGTSTAFARSTHNGAGTTSSTSSGAATSNDVVV